MRFPPPGLLLFALSLAPHVSPAAEAARANYDEARVPPYTLPDPLVRADGTPVRSAAEWRERRRPELLALFTREVYGRTPEGRPPGMHWKTISIDRQALGGKATRKEITVWFTARPDGPKMHVLVYQPNGVGAPWPVFLGLNYFGNHCVNPDPSITLSRVRAGNHDITLYDWVQYLDFADRQFRPANER